MIRHLTGGSRVAALILILVAGCAHKPETGGVAPDLTNAEVTILVRNYHLLDMAIYLLRNGYPERLGTAQGLSSKIFSLPWRRVEGKGDIRLGADPVGQNTMIRTEYLPVRPGSVVEWSIESALNQSSVSVH